MKYNIYLLSYNNYNNRQVKKLDTINDYINGGYLLSTIPNVNFEYADGIASQLIINKQFVSVEPDYVLVEDISSRVVDGLGNLVSSDFSRWFIIDSNLIRGNQYQFSVKRDIWVDHFDLCMNSTYFIERGYVSNANDLIFNNEQQQFSQIKKSQVELRDETYGPWIIGYIPRVTGKTSDFTIKGSANTDVEDITVADITQENWYQYTTNYVASDREISLPYTLLAYMPIKHMGSNNISYQKVFYEIDLKNKIGTNDELYRPGHSYRPNDVMYPGSSFNTLSTGVKVQDRTSNQYNSDKTDLGWYLENTINSYNGIQVDTYSYLNSWCNNMNNYSSLYDQMMNGIKTGLNLNDNMVDYINNNLKGKSVKDVATGKKYTILVDVVEEMEKLTISSDLNSKIRTLIPTIVTTGFGTVQKLVDVDSIQNYNLQVVYHIKKYKINLQETYGVQTIMPRDDESNGTIHRTHLLDAPYDMFAIPYTERLAIKSGNDTIYPNIQAGMAIASSFVTSLGDQVVYDLQILPYCPVRQFIRSDFSFDITAADNTQVRPIVDSANQNIILNYVFYCSSSQLENIKLRDANNNYLPYSIEISNYKLSCNVDTYRLCSPNFAAIFEFNAAKNGGVNYFEFSANYKPYIPYIKVKPHFDRLYGINAKDARGLILQGDFSIPTMSNAWTNYELQNKNYMNTFNREIDSLELQNNIAGTQDVFNAVSGTMQGATSGAITGGMTAGPYGAAAGAIIGGVSSAIGGGIDIYHNAILRNDAIDKAKDLFRYNMQNIKALPNTIRNVGCLTTDNLLVPLLEYYSASDDEIDAFNKKIQFYGMSIMKIGMITEYINPEEETFVQGKLLRLLPPTGVNSEADNHLAEEIAREISKGLYI